MLRFWTQTPRSTVAGVSRLREAGVEVHLGQGAQEAEEMYEGFAKFITTGLPFVTAKYAMSLDGKIATFEGDSQWITGSESRRLVHQRRTGVGCDNGGDKHGAAG